MTLYETLKTLTEPSREVDARISCALTGENEWPILSKDKQPAPMNKDGLIVGPTKSGTIGHISAPPITKDLNAVIELIEREMPGYGWRMTGGFHVFTEGILFPPGDFEPDIIGKHALPAVALLMALMDAKGFKQ